jgi:hypothetical protein
MVSTKSSAAGGRPPLREFVTSVEQEAKETRDAQFDRRGFIDRFRPDDRRCGFARISL